jgi:threonine dehydrogenase-like Zn-dependent dehydrogenase
MASLLPGSVVNAADKLMHAKGDHPRAEKAASMVSSQAKDDPSGKTMQGASWLGNSKVGVATVPKPTVTDSKDVVVRITSTAICGSDLHLYLGAVAGMKSGQILGHEPMGIVEEVGPNVTSIKKGDRVVVAFCLACGNCFFCKKQFYSCCDNTNPSPSQEKMFGQRTAGLLGHPELMGGFAGGQAEYLRVPFADVNCLVLPKESELPDDKVLFLSDILPTAWHGCELSQVGQGDIVAIWGAGPVGILTAQCAFARGARRVILVDKIAYRLEFASKVVKGVETVDASKSAGETQVLELCKDEPGGGPDCVIECVGMHYAHSAVHKVEMATGMETDSPEALNASLVAVRKGGRVGVIGAYGGFANHVNLGTLMQKGLFIATGQCPVQKYWKDLLARVQRNELDPSIVITHHLPLDEAANAYKMFNGKTDEVIKVVLHPGSQMGK